MTDHLPECPASRPDTPHVVSIAAEACQFWGICSALRACEARVRDGRVPAPLSCVDCGEPIYIRSNGDASHITPSAEGPHGIHYAVAPSPVHHDPMCRGKDGVNDCHCRLIAKVRKGERAAALDAAREAVANAIPVWDQDGWNVCSHKDALAAIDALRTDERSE